MCAWYIADAYAEAEVFSNIGWVVLPISNGLFWLVIGHRAMNPLMFVMPTHALWSTKRSSAYSGHAVRVRDMQASWIPIIAAKPRGSILVPHEFSCPQLGYVAIGSTWAAALEAWPHIQQLSVIYHFA